MYVFCYTKLTKLIQFPTVPKYLIKCLFVKTFAIALLFSTWFQADSKMLETVPLRVYQC